MSRAAVGALLGAALLLSACGGQAAPPAAPTAVGKLPAVSLADSPACPTVPHVAPRADGLPPLALPCLGAGPAVRVSDLRGVPLVVNVWAAWCTNCPREMPLFAAAQRAAGHRLRFFGVHYKAGRDQALAAAKDFGVPFPSVQDEDGDRVTRMLRVPGPPTTLFVTADGRLAGRKIGEIRSQKELRSLIQQYLGVSL
ncbi:MAG TPA: TlpA disulfide reductase family protein [Candidatus Eisenbacteria bacterium]|nr:TlpA disulfide reductase family protein [Candidatus Eisenbacteria bacterium]